MTNQESSRPAPIPVDPANVTPQMWNHGMFSPGNRASLSMPESMADATEPTGTESGETALKAAGLQLDTATEVGPVQGPMTAKEFVEHAESEAGKDGNNQYAHLFNPNYNAALDALEDGKSQVAPATGYTPSASVGKSWEQVKGVQDAVDAQRIAAGREPLYQISSQQK